MPVCVIGMHRSGTSLVANLLGAGGVYLGKSQELMPASADNRRGYWENLRFVKMNERILRAVGASWDLPPHLSTLDEWKQHPKLSKLKPSAHALIARFNSFGRWGWKDPRTSLTIPFWREIVADLRFVVCLRHPVEVAHSLRVRRHTPHFGGLILWRIYNQAILDYTLPAERIITHYDSYFTNPHDEAKRLLKFLEIEPSGEKLKAMMNCIVPDERHQVFPKDAASLSLEVSELYERMMEEEKTQ